MAAVTIRNLPDETLRALKKRAEQCGRSTEAEMRVILQNAVKTQVWIAISTYVLVAIVRKRLKLQASLYEILQILSLNLFETTPMNLLLTLTNPHDMQVVNANQLNLFEF